MANEDCLRIDSDVILNDNIKAYMVAPSYFMTQFFTYDLYLNKPGITCPLIYSKAGLEIIKYNIDSIDYRRPETSAWRLEDINENTQTVDAIVGIHGFFQDEATINRARVNKFERRQEGYDWEFVNKVMSLK